MISGLLSKGTTRHRAKDEQAPDPVVSFNVGGELFTTKASTLKRAGDDSMLSTLAEALIEQAGSRQHKQQGSPTSASPNSSWLRISRRHMKPIKPVEPSFDIVLDGNNHIFIDRDPGPMRFILKFLRSRAESDEVSAFQQLQLPPFDSSDFLDLLEDCRYYGLESLMELLKAQAAARDRMDHQEIPSDSIGALSTHQEGVVTSDSMRTLSTHQEGVVTSDSMRTLSTHQEGVVTSDSMRTLSTHQEGVESMRISAPSRLGAFSVSSGGQSSVGRVQVTKVKDLPEDQLARLRYNLLVVGVTGTGKSSSLNTLLDQELCPVSGAQAQGTRGCVLQEGLVVEEDTQHFVSFIDTQGLGADISITDVDLLGNIMQATDAIATLGIINNVLVSYDLTTRATAATMANQLTLTELFAEMRKSCFLMFTKWNTTGVQTEWNTPLRNWIKRWRKATSLEEINEDPPSYQEMFSAYCSYLVRTMAVDNDAGAFSKCASFMSFFNARILWMYNLDSLLVEDRIQGELPPHEERLYTFYRDRCLEVLELGSTEVRLQDLPFLHKKPEEMRTIAKSLILRRDKKIALHEIAGQDPEKTEEVRKTFIDMCDETAQMIGLQNFDELIVYSHKIAQIVGVAQTVAKVGCIIQ